MADSSEALILEVVAQRSIKSTEEIGEMEKASLIAFEMHTAAMRAAKPGLYEREIAGLIEGIALSRGPGVSFPVILSIRGEILHNQFHGNLLKDGDMLINDSGAESEMHYASDITRTFPVNGIFSEKQRSIYEIVLKAQIESINAVSPGKKNKDIHLNCARIIANGLKELGLMKGDVAEAVDKGAHALFFPHGLGHMLGLDVHDMEGLGEDKVGYNETVERSDQFGLAYLRLAKTLHPGYVLTIEPGIYFIPQLIDKWKNENKLNQFIVYSEVDKYRDFGGIRIEDNVVVTDKGHRLIGKPIPKTVKEVEETCLN
jgi:Xaa-Pro aminopeptidase